MGVVIFFTCMVFMLGLVGLVFWSNRDKPVPEMQEVPEPQESLSDRLLALGAPALPPNCYYEIIEYNWGQVKLFARHGDLSAASTLDLSRPYDQEVVRAAKAVNEKIRAALVEETNKNALRQLINPPMKIIGEPQKYQND